MNANRLYENLRKVHKIKKKQIRLITRPPKIPEDQEYREINLRFGTIWTTRDSSVPFDNKRKTEDFKDWRPSLVLNTPSSCRRFDLVKLAPGTSKIHNEPLSFAVPSGNNTENLKKTTYFLLYFSWHAVQKTLENKISELSEINKNKLRSLLTE